MQLLGPTKNAGHSMLRQYTPKSSSTAPASKEHESPAQISRAISSIRPNQKIVVQTPRKATPVTRPHANRPDLHDIVAELIRSH